jgi:NUMOD3 motif
MDEQRLVNVFLDNKYTKTYYRIISRANQRHIDGYVERHHIIPKSMGGSNNKENICRLTAREHFLCHWLLTKMTQGLHYTKMCLALHLMCTGKKIHLKYSKKITPKMYALIKLEMSQYMSVIAKKRNPITPETRLKLREAFYNNSKINSKDSIERRRLKRLGHSVSENTRNKIRNTLAKTREIKPCVGKPHSEETKRKISLANKKRITKVETKLKISIAKLGRKLSEATKMKMRKPKSKETKERMRLASIKREADKKLNGYVFPEKVKIKLREKHTCIHCGFISNKSSITRFHNDNCKMIKKDTFETKIV